LRIINLFRSTVVEIVDHEEALHKDEKERDGPYATEHTRRQDRTGEHTHLKKEAWMDAVMKGASGRGTAPAWKQTLVLAGLLIGFEGNGRSALPRGSRRTLVNALLERIIAAAQEVAGHDDDAAGHAIGLVLNYVWAMLDVREKAGLDWDVSRAHYDFQACQLNCGSASCQSCLKQLCCLRKDIRADISSPM